MGIIVISTAGLGTRLGEITKSRNKSLVTLNGRPIIAHQIEKFKKEQKVTEQKQEEVFTEKTGNTMTISEIDLLKNQLHGCLTLGPQVGSKDIKDLSLLQSKSLFTCR